MHTVHSPFMSWIHLRAGSIDTHLCKVLCKNNSYALCLSIYENVRIIKVHSVVCIAGKMYIKLSYGVIRGFNQWCRRDIFFQIVPSRDFLALRSSRDFCVSSRPSHAESPRLLSCKTEQANNSYSDDLWNKYGQLFCCLNITTTQVVAIANWLFMFGCCYRGPDFNTPQQRKFGTMSRASDA